MCLVQCVEASDANMANAELPIVKASDPAIRDAVPPTRPVLPPTNLPSKLLAHQGVAQGDESDESRYGFALLRGHTTSGP